jgi:CheY-like chemotaxis protein
MSGGSEPIQILLVEDDELEAELLERRLRRDGLHFALVRVQTAVAMTRALESGRWDIVLSDFNMPGFSGQDALALLRERANDVPFVFVSGVASELAATIARRLGAAEYVTKDDLGRVAPVILQVLGNGRNGGPATTGG